MGWQEAIKLLRRSRFRITLIKIITTKIKIIIIGIIIIATRIRIMIDNTDSIKIIINRDNNNSYNIKPNSNYNIKNNNIRICGNPSKLVLIRKDKWIIERIIRIRRMITKERIMASMVRSTIRIKWTILETNNNVFLIQDLEAGHNHKIEITRPINYRMYSSERVQIRRIININRIKNMKILLLRLIKVTKNLSKSIHSG